MHRQFKRTAKSLVFIHVIGLSFAISLLAPQFASATPLGDLATQMLPGTWAALTTTNINTALGDSVSGGVAHILPYSDKLHWDPLGRRAYFRGSDDPGNGARWVYYDEATNAWVVLVPSGGSGVEHQYGLADIDTINRRIYRILPNGDSGQRYNIAAGNFTSLPSFPAGPFSCCGAAAYFPERGGLVYIWGTSVRLLSDAGSWSTIATGINTSYHAVAHYNPVHKLMVFGGGNDSSRTFYRLSATGGVTPLAQPPVNLESPRVEFVTDPVTGDFLVFSIGQSFYVYHPLTDTWTPQSSSGIPIFNGQSSNLLSTVATAIPTYGVIMFATCESGGPCDVYLYKHAQRSDTMAPATPANLLVR